MQKLPTYKLIKQTFGLETYLEKLHDINKKKNVFVHSELVPIGLELREGGILMKSQSTGYVGNVI